ncbi:MULTISPECIES: hypothetical protein, partial [unclassified Endozoicomonas]
ANPEKAKRTVNAARQPKDLKPGIRVSNELFNAKIHDQYLFQLDNNIIKEVRLIEANPERFLQQTEKKISAFKKAVVKNKNPTNELGLGYYSFLKALAMMRAKMSDDDKTIELSFSPEVRRRAKEIEEAISISVLHCFPYVRMLRLFYEHVMQGEAQEKIINAYFSALSGVSQSIEILLAYESNPSVLGGMLLKWLVVIPKPFELKLAFDRDTYMENPKSNIPGRITPSIRLLREFLEQLPIKGSDGAVDLILNRMSQQFTDSQHLPDEQQEQVATGARAAAEVAAKANADAKAAAKAAAKANADAKVAAKAAAKANADAKAAAKANADTQATAIAAVEATALATAAAAAAMEATAAATMTAKAAGLATTEAVEETARQAEEQAILRLILYFATGRPDLLDFYTLDLSSILIRFSVLEFVEDAPNSLLTALLIELQETFAENIDPEKRSNADLIELAFHLVGASPEAEPLLYHLKSLKPTDQARTTALHFGHDLQFLTKLIEMSPELVSKDNISYWYNTLLLVHESIIRQIGGNPEKAIKLQGDSGGWISLRKLFIRHIWHGPPTVKYNAVSWYSNYAVFHSNNLEKFSAGNESAFIAAIKQSREVGYQILKQQLDKYDDKTDSQSLQMSGWLHCLAGLTLLEAEISSDHKQVVLTGRKRALTSAHDHFRKSRQAGFPYGGYLESLVGMRLDSYQYYQSQTSEATQTAPTNKPVIQYTSTKKPAEKIFIEAGKIVTELLPELIVSSICGVRFAAEAAIRIFTDERFNLLHIPQA